MTKTELAQKLLDEQMDVARTEARISKVMLAIRKMQDKAEFGNEDTYDFSN